MHRHRTRLVGPRVALLASLTFVAVLAGCGDDTIAGGAASTPATTTTTPATSGSVATAPTVVLRYVTDGGCVVMGPNCPTYTVWSNGKVEISRTHVDGPAEITGTVSAEAVQAWLATVQDLDVDALAKEVGPGTCNSCVDGSDILATIELPDGPAVLDSTKLAFDPANPTFADLERLMTAVRAVGELPLRTGG